MARIGFRRPAAGVDGTSGHPVKKARLQEPANVVHVKDGELDWCGDRWEGAPTRLSYRIYDVWSGRMRDTTPLVVLWLRGAAWNHDLNVDVADLANVQHGFQRRIVFVVPQNMRPDTPGCLRFEWGWAYPDRGSAACLAGELYVPMLHSLGYFVSRLKVQYRASHRIAMGYGMGGFGVLQVLATSPIRFDLAVVVAGYGPGTYGQQKDAVLKLPLAEASKVLDGFVAQYGANIALTRNIIVVHAREDRVSLYGDMHEVVNGIRRHNAKVTLITVPHDMANSDGTGERHHHAYYSCMVGNQWCRHDVFPRARDALAN